MCEKLSVLLTNRAWLSLDSWVSITRAARAGSHGASREQAAGHDRKIDIRAEIKMLRSATVFTDASYHT